MLMVEIEKVNRNYENKDGTRNYCANEGVSRVRHDGEYIGSVYLTNYSNDSTSRWIVWEWKDASDKDDTFIQHFNCRWFGKFEGLRIIHLIVRKTLLKHWLLVSVV